MIKAIVKQIDIGGNWLDTIYPDDPKCFGYQITISIGFDDEIGSEYFNLFVCTPEWLLKNEWEPKWGRHMLIVRKYDIDLIKEIIHKRIEECICNTWSETANKLSRYFAWEFEDYQS